MEQISYTNKQEQSAFDLFPLRLPPNWICVMVKTQLWRQVMKQRKKYPKTATDFGVVAGALFIAGFANFAFFSPSGFMGLIAFILALGPDQNGYTLVYSDCSDNSVQHNGGLNMINGQHLTDREAGYSSF